MSEPVAVLGAEAAGLEVARGLARAGRKVVLIAPEITGDPSLRARWLRYGLEEMGRRYRQHVTRLTQSLENTPGIRFVRGRARFREPYQLEVRGPDAGPIQARQIVIASGTEPVSLEIPGLERPLTSETVYELERPPQHLAVVGAGVIALEAACAFRKLGSRVSLVARGDRLLGRESSSVSIAMLSALQRQGVDVRLDALPFLYADGLLQLRPEGEVEQVDAVLLAIGRRPRVEELELDRAGLPGTLSVDGWCRTDIRGIYAVQDVLQARRVVQHLTQGWLPERPAEGLVPTVTFCDPEVASVRVAKRARSARTLMVALSELDRGDAEGFLEVEVESRSGRLQAVTLVAPHASENISFFTLAMQEKIPLSRLSQLVFPHPTVSEAVRRLSEEV